MYESQPSFILGFHGCDESLAEKVFSGSTRLRTSNEDYDWLGHGIYFWENSPERAMQWAEEKKKRSTPNAPGAITNPAVIGAIINLGNCLSLFEAKSLSMLRDTHESLVKGSETAGSPLPENKPLRDSKDLIFRHLDCAVIEHMHNTRKDAELVPYDSLRGVFFEGKNLYVHAGFKEKNHIQVCVRNPNCIKGYFRVLKPVTEYSVP